jgi:uncharacterized protein
MATARRGNGLLSTGGPRGGVLRADEKLRFSPLNLIVFVVLAYALTWAWWLPLAFSHMTVVSGSAPTHIPGLLGPALAGLVAAWALGGRVELGDLVRRIALVRFPWKGWAAALSPLAFLGIGLAVSRLADGAWPDLSGFGRYSGIPQYGVAVVLAIVLVANGFGEEVGWRGYALPRLQARFGPRGGTLLLYPIWALWHLPMFWCLASFMQMSPFTLVFGWGLGLFAGNVVLANVTHLARGSVFAAAVWHFTYNAAAATDLGATTQMIATMLVMVWAAFLLWHERKPRETSLLSVPAPAAPASPLLAPAAPSLT